MEIINRQNSDKTQGKKIQIEIKYTTISYFACFSIFDAVADDDSALFVLLLLFILWRSFFVVILSVLQLFYTKKKINYIFEFLIDFKWYSNILFQLNVFLFIFSILCCHFLFCGVIFLLFAVMQCTSLIIFRWQIKTLMVKIPIKQMTSDRFYVHKIRCDKKNSSLNSKWPFLYYLLTHKALE